MDRGPEGVLDPAELAGVWEEAWAGDFSAWAAEDLEEVSAAVSGAFSEASPARIRRL